MKNKKNYLLPVLLISLLFARDLALAQPLKPQVTPAGVKFSFEAPVAAGISIAGDFNNWTADKDMLYKNEEGIWEITYPLKNGKYEYKFVVDGSWTEGSNILLELKGEKLVIPEKKGTVTQYSGSIGVSGKLDGIMYSYYDRYDSSWKIDSVSSSIHFDMDWNASPMKEAAAYARMEMDTRANDFNLKFKQGHFNFTPEGIALRAYYNEKFIQFNDSLKILDGDVSLRYEKIDFFNEKNIHKAFGYGSQGIHFASEYSGYSGELFYSNMDDTSEDLLGIFVNTPYFGERIALGTGFISDRGRQWTYSNSANWFPVPDAAQGRSTVSSSSVQPWYKGFVQAGKTVFDLKFKLHDDAELFAEYITGTQDLSAVRWNEGGASDAAIDKKWPLKNTADTVVGLKIAATDKLDGEISFRNTKQKLGKILYESRKADTNTVTGKLKYSNGGYSAGVQASNSVSKNLGGDIVIDSEFYPYYRQLTGYAGFDRSNIPENDIFLMPFVSADLDFASFKIYGRFHNYEMRNLKQVAGVYMTDISSGKFGAKTREAIFENSIKIKGPLYLDGSIRYSAYGFNTGVNSYLSTYQALALKLKNNISIKLGWGVDPEGLDEDIYEDNDLREEFLADKYDGGSSITEAERLLELEKRISIKAEIKF